jgi:hypothetical protein
MKGQSRRTEMIKDKKKRKEKEGRDKVSRTGTGWAGCICTKGGGSMTAISTEEREGREGYSEQDRDRLSRMYLYKRKGLHDRNFNRGKRRKGEIKWAGQGQS